MKVDIYQCRENQKRDMVYEITFFTSVSCHAFRISATDAESFTDCRCFFEYLGFELCTTSFCDEENPHAALKDSTRLL